MIAAAEMTMNDLNDIWPSPVPPAAIPPVGFMWRNTSVVPNELLAWNGKGTDVAREYSASKNGTSVVIEDLSDDRSLGVTVKTVATQAAGAVSPTTPRAISGKASVKVRRAGKNLFDPGATSTSNGITKTVNSDGSITLNGTATATAYFYANTLSALDNTFTLSANNPVANANVSIRAAQASGSIVKDLALSAIGAVAAPFTSSIVNEVAIRVASGTTLSNFIIKPQIEVGSVVTAFEKYAAADYALTPSATLYGLTGAEDESGSDGHVTHRTAFVSLTSATTGTITVNTDTVRLVITLGGTGIADTPAICSHFAKLYSGSSDTPHYYVEGNQYLVIFVPKSLLGGVYTLAGIQTWLGNQVTAGTPVQVVYKRTTPTTANVAPVEINGLDGQNVITSDGASVAVTYTGSGWAAVGAVERIAIEAVEITPELGIKVSQILTDGTNTKNVYTQLYSQGLKIFDADTGDLIGGLFMRNGEVFLFSSALADPRVSSDTSVRLKSFTNGIAMLFKKGTTDMLEIRASTSEAQQLFSQKPVSIASSGTYGSSFIVSADGAASMEASNAGGTINHYLEVNATEDRIYASRSITVSSDGRYKDFLDDVGRDKFFKLIMGIDPRAFRYKTETEDNGFHSGFDANHVKKVMDEIGLKDWRGYSLMKDGRSGLTLEEFIAPIVSVVQKQQDQIEEQGRQIEELKRQVSELAKRLG